MVNAICRRCQKPAPANDFKLHYKHKMMVCPACYSGRTDQLRQQEQQKQKASRPPGWDAEDEYLIRVSEMRKEENQAQFSKIPGTSYVKCTCAECRFEFRYNPFKKTPRTCPYCNAAVPKLKTFNLL